MSRNFRQRDVTREEAQKFADDNGLIFLECSAKTYIFSPFPWMSHEIRGENVEDAFLETAKKIFQNIQDGRFDRCLLLGSHRSVDLNAAESGVQHKSSTGECVLFDLSLSLSLSLFLSLSLSHTHTHTHTHTHS
jgi:hypothetical protein